MGWRRDKRSTERGSKLLTCCVLVLSAPVFASGIATDGTLGPAVTLGGPGYIIDQSLGARRGGNLFHSFREFSIANGESATFTGDPDLENVISRVTGGGRSQIDGLLRSQVGQANFYLVNPAGAVFGPTASIDVPAAFHVSSADELRFADGGVFSATDPSRTTLSIQNPDSFAFLAPQPVAITINGSRLSVSAEEMMSLTGGDLLVENGASLSAQGGQVTLTAVGAAGGEVSVADGAISTPPEGTLTLSGGSSIDVSSVSGTPTIAMAAGSVILDGSRLSADYAGPANSMGGIDIAASTISLSDSQVSTIGFGAGSPGDITLTGDVVAITDSRLDARLAGSSSPTQSGAIELSAGISLALTGSQIDVTNFGSGVGQNIVLRGRTTTVTGSELIADVAGADGANEVLVISELLNMQASNIRSNVFSSGRGAPIRLLANAVLLDAESSISTTVASAASGDAGGIEIDTNFLGLLGGSRLRSGTEVGSTGNAGSITISSHLDNVISPGNPITLPITPGAIVVSPAADGTASGVVLDMAGSGAAGDLLIQADGSALLNGALLSSSAANGASGGDLTVDAGSELLLQDSTVSTLVSESGTAGDINLGSGADGVVSRSNFVASSSGVGNAGNITLAAAGEVNLADAVVSLNAIEDGQTGRFSIQSGGGIALQNAIISHSAEATGVSAPIQIEATGDLRVDQSRISASNADLRLQAANIALNSTELTTRTDVAGTRNGGIELHTTVGDTRLTDSTLRTTGLATADAGELQISTRDLGLETSSSAGLSRIESIVEDGLGSGIHIETVADLQLSGNSVIRTVAQGSGGGAAISVASGGIVVAPTADGSVGGISSETLGGGNGGQIDVRSSSGVQLTGGGTIQSVAFFDGRGGDVAVEAEELSLSSGSLVQSINLGSGDGGDVDVNVNGAARIENSSAIRARSFGAGNAGNIDLSAGSLTATGSGTQLAGVLNTSDGSGAAGDIIVDVANDIRFTAGGLIFNGPLGSGETGSIDVSARNLFIDNQGHIGLRTGIDSFAGGTGTGLAQGTSVRVVEHTEILNGGFIGSATLGTRDAGGVSLETGTLLIDGTGTSAAVGGQHTGIFSQAVRGSAGGDAGDVHVSSRGHVQVQGSGLIGSQTFAGGDGGAVHVEASSLSIVGGEDVPSRINSATQPGSTGAGGDLRVEVTGQLEIAHGAQIDSSVGGPGDGGDLSIVAGTLLIDGTNSVNLAAIGTEVQPGAQGDAGNLSVDISGHAVVQGNAAITALTQGSGNAGEILVRADSLTLRNSTIPGGSTTVTSSTLSSGAAGAIRIEVAGSLNMEGQARILGQVANSGHGANVEISAGTLRAEGNALGSPTISAGSDIGSTGNAGDVQVAVSGSVQLLSGAEITTSTNGAGAGGGVTLSADSLNIRGDSIDDFTGIAAQTAFGSGDAGNIDINIDGALQLTSSAEIIADTSTEGEGGDINVQATSLRVSGDRTGIGTTTRASATGSAGDIRLEIEGSVQLDDGATVSAETFSAGDAGNLAIRSGSLSLADASELRSAANPTATGQAGGITITAGPLALRGGSRISAASEQRTLGAQSAVATPQAPLVINASQVALQEHSVITTQTTGPADASDIAINATGMTASSGSAVLSQSSGSGLAGTISLALSGALVLDDANVLASSSASGGGGGISIEADTLTATRSSRIASETRGSGAAGNLGVRVGGATRLDGRSVLSTTTFSTGAAGEIDLQSFNLKLDNAAIESRASGSATSSVGNITLTGSDIVLRNGSSVSIASEQRAGDLSGDSRITVRSNGLRLEDASRITAESSGTAPASDILINTQTLDMKDLSAITTESVDSDGGDITIVSTDRIAMNDSRITTSVTGQGGNGGDIAITTGTLMMDGGFIQANTATNGASGGNVTVNADQVVAANGLILVGGDVPAPFVPGSGLNVIQAAAPSGVEGVVSTSFSGSDIPETVVPLTAELADENALFADECRPPGDNDISSLVVRGATRRSEQLRQRGTVSVAGRRLAKMMALSAIAKPGAIAAQANPRSRGVPGAPAPTRIGFGPAAGKARDATDQVHTPASSALPALGESFILREVRFEGGERLPTDGFRAIYAPELEHRVTLSDLEELRFKLTRHLVDQGFVTSGVVVAPNQTVNESVGTVQFQIIEGHLSEIRVTDGSGLSDRYIRERLRPDPTQPLNRKALEQRFRDLLEDPLVDRIDGQLMPGLRPGETVLKVDVTTARPWDLYVRANNYRPPSTGAERGYIGGTIRNLSGHGEALSFYYGHGLGNGGREGGVEIRIPLASVGTEVFARFGGTDASLLQEPVRDLDISSKTWRFDLGLNHPIWRTPDRSLTFGAQLTLAKNATTLLGESFSFSEGAADGESKVSALRFPIDYVERLENRAVALRSVLSTGIDAFDATIHDYKDRPDGQFVAWLGQGHYVHRLFNEDITLSLRGAVQLASDRLLALEQFAVGGVSTVRGYRENELVGDNGFAATMEVKFPVWKNSLANGWPVDLRMSVFSDVGSAWNKRERQSAELLWSAGITASLSLGRQLTADVSYGVPIKPAPDREDDNLQDYGLQFQVQYEF